VFFTLLEGYSTNSELKAINTPPRARKRKRDHADTSTSSRMWIEAEPGDEAEEKKDRMEEEEEEEEEEKPSCVDQGSTGRVVPGEGEN